MADDQTTQKISPYTGLPYVVGGPNDKKEKISPFTGKPYAIKSGPPVSPF